MTRNIDYLYVVDTIILMNALCVIDLFDSAVEIYTQYLAFWKIELEGNNDELRDIVIADPSETTEILVAWFDVK